MDRTERKDGKQYMSARGRDATIGGCGARRGGCGCDSGRDRRQQEVAQVTSRARARQGMAGVVVGNTRSKGPTDRPTGRTSRAAAVSPPASAASAFLMKSNPSSSASMFAMRCAPAVPLGPYERVVQKALSSAAARYGKLVSKSVHVRLMTEAPPRQRVCVVGSGISGLSISWLLSDAYDVTILEKHERLGMDAHGLMVTGTDGSSIRLDAPPRAISADFYYNLMQLYKQADVAVEPWSWSFCCAVLGCPRAFFRLTDSKRGGEGFLARTLGFRFPDLATLSLMLKPATLKMAYDGWCFYRDICRDHEDVALRDMSMGAYLERGRYADGFVYGILLPLFSMICTCSYESVKVNTCSAVGAAARMCPVPPPL